MTGTAGGFRFRSFSSVLAGARGAMLRECGIKPLCEVLLERARAQEQAIPRIVTDLRELTRKHTALSSLLASPEWKEIRALLSDTRAGPATFPEVLGILLSYSSRISAVGCECSKFGPGCVRNDHAIDFQVSSDPTDYLLALRTVFDIIAGRPDKEGIYRAICPEAEVPNAILLFIANHLSTTGAALDSKPERTMLDFLCYVSQRDDKTRQILFDVSNGISAFSEFVMQMRSQVSGLFGDDIFFEYLIPRIVLRLSQVHGLSLTAFEQSLVFLDGLSRADLSGDFVPALEGIGLCAGEPVQSDQVAITTALSSFIVYHENLGELYVAIDCCVLSARLADLLIWPSPPFSLIGATVALLKPLFEKLDMSENPYSAAPILKTQQMVSFAGSILQDHEVNGPERHKKFMASLPFVGWSRVKYLPYTEDRVRACFVHNPSGNSYVHQSKPDVFLTEEQFHLLAMALSASEQILFKEVPAADSITSSQCMAIVRSLLDNDAFLRALYTPKFEESVAIAFDIFLSSHASRPILNI